MLGSFYCRPSRREVCNDPWQKLANPQPGRSRLPFRTMETRCWAVEHAGSRRAGPRNAPAPGGYVLRRSLDCKLAERPVLIAGAATRQPHFVRPAARIQTASMARNGTWPPRTTIAVADLSSLSTTSQLPADLKPSVPIVDMPARTARPRRSLRRIMPRACIKIHSRTQAVL